MKLTARINIFFLCGACLLMVFTACKKEEVIHLDMAVAVRAVVATETEQPDELAVFGSLAWEKKFEIKSPQDAQVQAMFFREGDLVRTNQVVARLYNPQVTIAVERAGNGLERARAALLVAEARLREGILAAESRLLTLEKSQLELQQAERELAETERKHLDQEQLFAAGGVTEEVIRGSRFALESARERIVLMRKDMEIRAIGTRPIDLVNAGMAVPTNPAALRQSILNLNTATLRAERDASIAGVSTAQGELDSARLVDQELVILAPAGGTVGARHVEVGERVKRDDQLFTVIDMAILHAVVPVNEAEAVRLTPGMSALISIEALDREVEGRIELIAPIADSRTASFSVRIRLMGRVTDLRPGMFVKCLIRLGPARTVLVVPESALFSRSGENASLFVVAAGKAQARSVATGVNMGTDAATTTAGGDREMLVIVLSGLRPGEVVILNPPTGLREGDSVNVQ